MPRTNPIPYNNSINYPLFNSSSYCFENTAQIIKHHEDKTSMGRYARYDNPNWIEVERKLAELDGCEEALLFPSGMSAISTTLLSLLKPNDTFVFTGKGYRNIQAFCNTTLKKFDVNVIPLTQDEMTNASNYIEISKPYSPKVIFIEMPSNPHLYLTDIEYISNNKSKNTILIVDSTFASPINFTPKKFGADLIIHSCSKYIGGHLDLMAGSVAGDMSMIQEIRNMRNETGAIADSHTAFLLGRSIHTLDMRMKYLNKSGLALASYLEKHNKVKKVFYPSKSNLSESELHLVDKYLKGYGGVVAFEINGDKSTTSSFVDNLKIPFMATNFGSQYSLVEQCSVFTYYHNTPEENMRLGITNTLVRYSCGFEPVNEIIDDIEQALNKI